MVNLWDCEETVVSLGIDVPAWIKQSITPYNVAAIIKGGCASGAYMPAVTYHKARETMAKHGDDVLDYIKTHKGELPQVPNDESWSGISVFFLSCAVEVWAHIVESEIKRVLDDGAEGEEG